MISTPHAPAVFFPAARRAASSLAISETSSGDHHEAQPSCTRTRCLCNAVAISHTATGKSRTKNHNHCLVLKWLAKAADVWRKPNLNLVNRVTYAWTLRHDAFALEAPNRRQASESRQHLQFPLLFRLLFTRVDITATSAIVALLPAGHFTPPRSGSQREVIVTKPFVAP